MGDFKRNSSRFSRGGGSGSNGGGGSRSSGGSSGGSRSGGYSRGGGNGGGYSRGRDSGGGGGDKKFPFTRVASLTVPKSASDEMAEYVGNELKGSEIRLNAKVYLGKGDDNSLTLRNGDMLLISFKTSDKDPEYVVGNVSIKNGD